MADRRIVVQITGDSRQLERAFQRSSRAATGFQSQVGGISKSLKAGLVGAGIAIGGTQVLSQIQKSVSAASDLNEQMSKTRQVFGASSAEVVEWSETTADALGISQRAALAATGTFGNLFRTIKLAPQVAAGMSQALVQLAADLASFNNASPEDVLVAIRSGLIGEAEPLRRYGVLLSEARVQQLAMATSGKTNVKALTDQEKAMARYEIIMRDTVTAQGDFARTSGGLANQSRTLSAQWADLSASLGQSLVPALTSAAVAANQLFAAFARLSTIKGPSLKDILGPIKGPSLLDLFAPGGGGAAAPAAPLRPEDIGGARGPGAIAAANAAKAAIEAAKQLARSQKAYATIAKGLGLKADKARLTTTLADDIVANDELIRAIQRQIRAEGKTFDLVNDLTQARLAGQALRDAQAAQAQAASQAAAADAEQRAREAEERAREALERRRTQRLARQFKALGLTAEGQQRVPGVEALRRRGANLLRQIEGTALDTPKTRATLAKAAKVLSGDLGKVGREVRSAILQMYNDISGAFKDGDKSMNVQVTSTQRRGVGKILEGLGLTPEQVRALRQRLAKGGTIGGFGAPAPGGGVPAGAGRGDVVVNGNLVVTGVRDVDQFVKEVQRKGKRSSASRRGTTPGQNRALA